MDRASLFVHFAPFNKHRFALELRSSAPLEHASCISYRYKPCFLSAGLAGRHGTTVAVFSDVTHLLTAFAACIDQFIDGTGVAPLRTSPLQFYSPRHSCYRRHTGDSH
jgi:hypothetical protein